MVGMRAEKRSTTSVEGVIGYPAANRAPAARAPSQQAWSPSRKWTPVRTPLGSACMRLRTLRSVGPQLPSIDGEVRAVHPAEVATATFFRGYDVRGMVSLGVKSRR